MKIMKLFYWTFNDYDSGNPIMVFAITKKEAVEFVLSANPMLGDSECTGYALEYGFPDDSRWNLTEIDVIPGIVHGFGHGLDRKET